MMIQTERHLEILRLININGRILVPEICERFGVSEMTARRDLRLMDQQGLLRRVHGGGVSSLGRSYEPPLQMRTTKNAEAKQAIGRRAAELVFDGDSIALDVGSTTLEVARNLHNRHNLTIVTSSLPIANEIVSNYSLNSDVRLLLTGGIVRAGELSMIGHVAEQTFRELHVDKAFIGAAGVSIDEGLTEYNLEDALVKRSLLTSAKKKIVVIDGSKLGRTTFATIGPLSSIDTIVTDASGPDGIVRQLREKGVEVLISNSNKRG